MEGSEARIEAVNGAIAPLPPPPEKRTYSVDEIMRILDISRSTAYVLIKRGLFKSVKAGKQIRVSKKSFDAWLDTL